MKRPTDAEILAARQKRDATQATYTAARDAWRTNSRDTGDALNAARYAYMVAQDEFRRLLLADKR